MTSFRLRIVLAAGLTVLADLLLFDRALGLGLTVFFLVLIACTAISYKSKIYKIWPWFVLWIIIALGATFDYSVIGLALLVFLGWAGSALCLLDSGTSFYSGSVRGFTGGVRSFSAVPSDMRRFYFYVEIKLCRLTTIWVFIIPTFLVILFGALIIPANVVMMEWITQFFSNIERYFFGLTINRVLFWWIVGFGIYGFFRFRLGKRKSFTHPRPDEKPESETRRDNILKICIWSLAALNGLYVIANALDLMFLWLSFELPQGLTYAQFAHQGSYRLILAVVLASFTVTVLMPTNSKPANSSLSRKLAYVFILQNLILMASAAKRLFLYVEVYGLTRFRVAAALWMILVGIGFLLIIIRIARRFPVFYLFRANTVSAVLFLSVVTFMNLDGIIAEWNVRRYEKGEKVAVDVEYLKILNASAIPSLVRLGQVASNSGNNKLALEATTVAIGRLAEEKNIQSDWRSWTWRRAEAIKATQDQLNASKGNSVK